jgi:hypothetical protein
MALIKNGFKQVATYKRYKKNWDKSFTAYTIEAWTDEKQFILRYISDGKMFTKVFTDKDKANNEIKERLADGYKKVK